MQDVQPPVTQTLIFPPDRPSERPTRPTLPPPEDPSSEDLDSVMELSESDFVDDGSASAAKASTFRPPPLDGARPVWLDPALRASAAALFLFLVLVVVLFVLLDSSAVATPAREPRVAWPDRTSMTAPALASPPAPAPHGCVAIDAPRFVAPRALINPGLDVSSSATGFVVAFAAAKDEASALRLEGSTLRAAENVRARTNSLAPIRRVVAKDTDADVLEVHADADDGRTVIPDGDAPAFRIAVAGAYVVARVHDRTHSLWPLPLPPTDRRLDALRVAPRDEGGAVVVMKRGSTLHVGLVNGALSAMGPLTSIDRGNALLGTPFVVAHGAGAAVAWAERPAGAREWTVVLASLGGGETETKTLDAGISPSLAVLPDTGLLVAYADGPAGSHRIVVRRLAPDFTPSGDAVVVSPPGINAGQPVIDVRTDGRALVAWLAVSRGQPAAVHATPLQCDVSTLTTP